MHSYSMPSHSRIRNSEEHSRRRRNSKMTHSTASVLWVNSKLQRKLQGDRKSWKSCDSGSHTISRSVISRRGRTLTLEWTESMLSSSIITNKIIMIKGWMISPEWWTLLPTDLGSHRDFSTKMATRETSPEYCRLNIKNILMLMTAEMLNLE